MIDRLRWSAPLNCSLNVTGRCNLECLHCSASANPAYSTDMTTAQLREVINALDQAGICKVHVSGGEPLIREDFFEIVSTFRERKIPITLFTNATLVSSEVVRRLVSEGNILSISTSLDGSNPRSHDALRGDGTFDKAVKGIRLLVEAGFGVHATCIVSKLNMNELPQIAHVAKGLGIAITFNPAVLVGRARENKDVLELTKSEMDMIYDTVKSLAMQNGHVNGGTCLEWPRGKADFAKGIKSQTKPGGALCICGICKESISITPDGWVVPCNNFWEYEIGNMLTTDLREIWRSEKAQRIRELHTHTSDELDGCGDCLYTGMCGGGCRACAYASGKSLMGVDEFRCVKWYIEAEETAQCL